MSVILPTLEDQGIVLSAMYRRTRPDTLTPMLEGDVYDANAMYWCERSSLTPAQRLKRLMHLADPTGDK